MSQQWINTVFHYIGIDDDQYEELVNDSEFMAELKYVDKYAIERGMEYCLTDDLFRFSNKPYMQTENFTVYNR